ncbi:MAG: hypothetical protein HY928_17925 [Elusimicrobia bacterium]|nr:hypothetical protein [Elusimicrobiota bacterium]
MSLFALACLLGLNAWSQQPQLTEAQRAAARAALEGSSAAAPSGGAEGQAAREGALRDFLQGRYEAAAAGFRYVVTLGSNDAAPEAELALMLRDLGRPDDAAAHWLKATLLAPSDSFYWSQRAWNYLALGRVREARDAFQKGVETAQRSDDKGEALLGLGLAESTDGNDKAAAEPLSQAAEVDPYARAAANAELARIALRRRRPADAVPFARASLSADPAQLDVAKDLGTLFEKTGEGTGEWQALKMVLGMDPADAGALKRKAALEKWLAKRPQDSLPVLRLGRPIFREDEDEAAGDEDSPPIRVGLFSGPDGAMRHATHFYVMGSTATRLFDVKLQEEVVAPAAPFQQWEVAYRPDNRVIEVRDPRGRIVYVTKQPFRLIPSDPRFTVLLKNVELTDIAGMDIGDRELRGVVEVIPTPDGFHIVNELPLDRYLFSIVGESLPPDAPLEAYKVMAVLGRTEMLERMRTARPTPESVQTCDSKACFVYTGLTRERENSAKAVRETRGVVARIPEGTLPERHASCGWATAPGIQDRQVPALTFRSPGDLERLFHRGPDEALYHQASALIPESWNRWVRVLDAEEVRRRIEAVKEVGPLKRVTVTGRDATGRVRGMRFEGARGDFEAAGLKDLELVLSPGSLRSELFVVTPVYDGRKVKKLVLWGAGYGHGRGVCVAGTVGQASLGRRFDQILRHYYPKLALPGYTPPPEPPAPRPEVTEKKPGADAVRPPRKRHAPAGPAKKKPRIKK